MARSDAVWGIDIGQCALKALRCRPHEESSRIIADAFDYIEYPKILSQPDADPVELVRDALKQFLSRNSVRGDRVVISVSGQSGLARFIKLPPVETSRIPDIVRYEARQQIPFALEDVVWDYQQMVGGMVVEGFAMETEVGLFAMKRDQVDRTLKPYNEAGIEVDFVQLTPLALYNFVAFDQMPNLPPPDEYDPESPPESIVVLSLGTDTTDLVVTNGFRVWQRSIPIGGNHFTKELTKQLKLTFASAEHLKRNPNQADDPKALFQAMRPVFNNLLTEVQRSIGYFGNLDRRAKIGRGLALGNAMKLPGLQRYLAQNLGFDLVRLETFRGLSGSAVTEAPAFKENAPAFGVCYGLALQGLRDTKIKTNLLPHEIRRDRLIRSKKPWAVGAAAALLLGFSLSYFSHWRAWNSVTLEGYFEPAISAATSVVTMANQHKEKYDDAKSQYAKTVQVGEGLIRNEAGHGIWLKALKAINQCLPHDPPGERPKELARRNEIHIESLECVRMDDLSKWYADVKQFEEKLPVAAAPAAQQPAAPAEGQPVAATPTPNGTTAADGAAPANGAAQNAQAADPAAAAGAGPTGPGWVFEIKAHHYHNIKGDPQEQGPQWIRNTLLPNLRNDEMKLGIGYPVLIDPRSVDWEFELEAADAENNQQSGAAGNAPADASRGGKAKVKAPRFDFVVQFCWQETQPDFAAFAPLRLPLAVAPAPATTVAPTTVAPGPVNTPADADSSSAAAGDSSTNGAAAENQAAPPAAEPGAAAVNGAAPAASNQAVGASGPAAATP